MKPVPVYIDKHRIVWTQDIPPNGVAMTNEERRQELVEAFNAGQESHWAVIKRYKDGELSGEVKTYQTAEDYLKEKGLA